MENRKFHHTNTKFWGASMHIMQIGWNGCNLIKKLDEDPKVNCVTIRGKIYDPFKIKIIMIALEYTQVKSLHLGNNSINSLGAKYIADGLGNSGITYISLYNSRIGDDGIKQLAEGLKNSKVISLDVASNGITNVGIKYLADALPNTNITSLTLDNVYPGSDHDNQVGDVGVEYLAKQLKYTSITYLSLESCEISNFGVKCLAEHLEDTCLTSVSLKSNNIDNDGVQYVVRILQGTRIVALHLGSVKVGFSTKLSMEEVMLQNNTKATKVKNIFQKLVAQNIQTHDLEFIIPDETKDFDMTEYSYIVKTITDNPRVKGHIFDMIKQNHCDNYPNIIKKINEFMTTISDKFNAFIDNNLPGLVELFDSHDFVNLVIQFESMELREIVQNLILHRVLYYVDESAEILHPYIYKMLDKYAMPLYNKLLEPNKKKNIISFYQNHQEVDGAQEIISLLES